MTWYHVTSTQQVNSIFHHHCNKLSSKLKICFILAEVFASKFVILVYRLFLMLSKIFSNILTGLTSYLNDLPSLSKDLHMPWGLNTPRRENWRETYGWRQRLQPPTIAESQCPSRRDLYACSNAYILEEQAESTV